MHSEVSWPGESNLDSCYITTKRTLIFQIYCMDEYDMSNLLNEDLLLCISSTFGAGDPPVNGEEFSAKLKKLAYPKNGHT